MLSDIFSNIKIETPNNMYSGSLSIAQPLFAGGRIVNGNRAARFGLEAQKLAHGRTVTEIGLSAQKIFWGYVGLLKGLEAVRETRQWFETLVQDQQKLFDKGLIIELDVLNTKIQADNFRLTEEKLNNSIKTVSDQLLLFLGLAPGGQIDPDTTMLSGLVIQASAPATDSVDQWLSGREDLRAMETQMKLQKTLKDFQLGAYWPTVSAFGTYGANNQYSIAEGEFKKSSSVGVQVSWTLLDWGKAWREAQKIDCQLQAVKLQADNLRDQIRLKYFELARKVAESGKACEIAREDFETARRALAVAKLKYDAQAITNTELLNARNQLVGKTVSFAQARINVILAMEEFRVAPSPAAGTQVNDQSGQVQTQGQGLPAAAGGSGGPGGGGPAQGGMGQ